MKKYILFLFLITILFASCKKKQDPISDVNQHAVQDYADIFSKTEEDSLSKIIIDYEKKSANQICVYTIDSIPTLVNAVVYATKIANRLGVGEANKDNGLFLLIARNNRKVAFATGYGTEKILTDSICKRLIDATLVPAFKKELFYEGVKQVLDSVKVKWIN